MKRSLPSPISILMLVIIIAAAATWLIPAGKYNTLSYVSGNQFVYSTPGADSSLPFTQQTLDSLQVHIPLEKFSSGAIRKPVSVPGTYQKLTSKRQGIIQVLMAPIKGFYDSVDIILFVLFIGGFMQLFNESGAMVRGLTSLSYSMKGKESWLIIILCFLFSFAGSSYGMAEETLVFYPVMVPLFLAAGYDLLVPVAVIFAGSQLGTLSSFTNPFSTIIASNAAGVNWSDGLNERIVMFILTTFVSIWYFVRYAKKVKADPTASIVYKIHGPVQSLYPAIHPSDAKDSRIDNKTKLLLLIFLCSFLGMIAGVVLLDWWLTEMTALFFGSSILLAIVLKLSENTFIKQFIQGCKDMFAVAMIIGVARGVTIILNEGQISDSILYYAANLASTMPPVLFIVMMLVLYMIFTLFISSSSGMAVLTMPIMGALAVLVHVPGREIVNAYLFGMGIMGFITPTGLVLPSLALVGIGFKAWWKFISPLLLILFILCAACLAIGIFLK
ncbi:MAG TPA: hypothetical protein PLC48_04475 [Ferruginibacter sp.]|nr:hypothetical protein [Ferruginibacter sp.]